MKETTEIGVSNNQHWTKRQLLDEIVRLKVCIKNQRRTIQRQQYELVELRAMVK